MARPVKIIDLDEPFEYHEKLVNRIGIKSPGGGDAVVDPIVYVRNRDGATYPVENEVVLRDLMDRLLVKPDGAEFDGGAPALTQFSLVDGMAIKGAVTDFFAEAERKIFAKRSTSSSSTTAS